VSDVRKYAWLVIVLLCAAGIATASETRIRYSNGTYGATTYFGGTNHPGTLFTPTGSQYPVYIIYAHYGFASANVEVQAKIWSATGSTPGSVLASFITTTKAYPTWTDVEVRSAVSPINSGNFFISTNNPGGGALGVGFKGAYPQTFPGHHFISQNDSSWSNWSTTDWAIECTIDDAYTAVRPASLGRLKALYK
jgi:hypothetical protein